MKMINRIIHLLNTERKYITGKKKIKRIISLYGYCNTSATLPHLRKKYSTDIEWCDVATSQRKPVQNHEQNYNTEIGR